MPRNSSGVYTLPQAAFVAGTVISSTAMNSNLSDIASALTQSIATNGSSVMTAPLVLAAGSVTAPSLTFAGNTTTGFYLIGTNSFGWTAAGVLAATFAAGGTVTWVGAHTYSSTATFNSTLSVTTGGVGLGSSQLQMAQCRLTLSGANLKLSPYQGNMLYINNANYVIPAAGVTLGNTSTALSTFYYIYAFISGSTMTLEASATVPTANAATACQQKTGDATRTLVGCAFTSSGNTWVDTDGSIFVLSYFNRKRKKSVKALLTDTSISSGTPVQVSANMQSFFINWGDEVVRMYATYVVGISIAAGGNGTVNPCISIDSLTAPGISATQGLNNTANAQTSTRSGTVDYEAIISEAVSHFVTMSTFNAGLNANPNYLGNGSGASVNLNQVIIEVMG